jgi:ABC-2 type transport system permease protein
MKIIWANFKIVSISLLRIPAYWVPTVLFPAMLFSFFGLPAAKTSPQAAAVVMASFSAFAVIGVSFYQFGIGIAQERVNPWDSYLRTLPTGPGPRIAAQLLVALVFGAGAASTVALITIWGAGLEMNLIRWLHFGMSLLIGAVPFTLMGIAIGYLAPPKAAVPLANLLHIPLTFAGGLWMRPSELPEIIQVISPYVPTRHLGEIVWASVLGQDAPLQSWLWLLGYSILFALLAGYGRARDEGERFR